MSAFFHAVHVFFDHLAAVAWTALAIAVSLHLLKVVVRTFAWRNILLAAFPRARIRRRTVFGAYVAGVGVNSIAPARGGDMVKLYLARHGIEGSNYPALTSSLVVETLFDFVASSVLFVWALHLGVLPSLRVLPDLPSVDWTWILRHPNVGAAVAVIVFVGAVILAFMAAGRIVEMKRNLAAGFAILGEPRTYLLKVASWQALSWVLRVASVWWFLRAFGLPATVHNALLVQVVQSLSTLLPFSPGGAGAQQGLAVYVLRGKASTTALLSFSVGMNVATTVANVVLGFGSILLTFRTVRWRRVVAADAPPAR
jgi:uncharacterized membrane protein YbhN (UPF0104 family)